MKLNKFLISQTRYCFGSSEERSCSPGLKHAVTAYTCQRKAGSTPNHCGSSRLVSGLKELKSTRKLKVLPHHVGVTSPVHKISRKIGVKKFVEVGAKYLC